MLLVVVGQLSSATASSVTYDFESISADWSSVAGSYEWVRRSGGTPSSGTGPSSGHAGSGYYYYTETSSPRQPGDIFELQYKGGACSSGSTVSFFYFMKGATIGSLSLVDATGSVVWSLTGDQGSTVWIEASADVTTASFAFKVMRGSSWTGDVAVDDVTVSCAASGTGIFPLPSFGVQTVQGGATPVPPSGTFQTNTRRLSSGRTCLDSSSGALFMIGTVEYGNIDPAGSWPKEEALWFIGWDASGTELLRVQSRELCVGTNDHSDCRVLAGSCAVDPSSGNVFVTTRSYIWPGQVVFPGGYHLLSSYSRSGVLLWQKPYGPSAYHSYFGLTAIRLHGGAMFLTGSAGSGFAGVRGCGHAWSTRDECLCVVKLDMAGTVIWVKCANHTAHSNRICSLMHQCLSAASPCGCAGTKTICAQ